SHVNFSSTQRCTLTTYSDVIVGKQFELGNTEVIVKVTKNWCHNQRPRKRNEYSSEEVVFMNKCSTVFITSLLFQRIQLFP
ncbi:unnamed protein product, partial [Trichobilharzia szidati]